MWTFDLRSAREIHSDHDAAKQLLRSLVEQSPVAASAGVDGLMKPGRAAFLGYVMRDDASV